jgi:cystathionine gamma-lyase/cystathionine gamma-lyase/homocysteine desulfhydrase
MDPATRVLHHRIETEGARPSVTPLYQSSAFEAGSPYFYTRKNNPNTAEFEEAVAGIEGCAHGVAVSTGMAAIRACLELLRPGDTIAINHLIYGCSFKLIQRFAHRFGVQVAVLDLSSSADIDRIPAATRMVLFETPTNPFLKTIDIAAVTAEIRRKSSNALVVVDNTWATPVYQHPLEFGADVSLHSATKYLSGHSDVMGGILLTNRDDLADFFRHERFYSGAVLDPYAAWLLRRSLQTLGVRVERQSRTAFEMRSLLMNLPQIRRVFYPDIDGTQLTGYAGILFAQLRPDLVDSYPELVRSLRCFGSGTGMACVTSMVAQPYTGSHASLTEVEKEEMGLTRGLVRFCFGLEDPEDLRNDLQTGLASLEKPVLAGVIQN